MTPYTVYYTLAMIHEGSNKLVLPFRQFKPRLNELKMIRRVFNDLIAQKT